LGKYSYLQQAIIANFSTISLDFNTRIAVIRLFQKYLAGEFAVTFYVKMLINDSGNY
jgi:hypothetical protein